MAIKKEGKRAKWGQMLTDAEGQANNAFSMLDAVKQQLTAGKNKMQNDIDFGPEDLEEVEASIAIIDAKYKP
jgi:hypothetical protein